MKQKKGDFKKVSHFLIEKAVTSCTGSGIQEIRKAAGGLLVKTLNDDQGSRLLKLHKIRDIEVEVVHHTTLFMRIMHFDSRSGRIELWFTTIQINSY